MLCSNCIKLSSLPAKKKCIKCQGDITTNINVLCDFCSASEKKCAVCIKKVSEYYINKSFSRNCGCHK